MIQAKLYSRTVSDIFLEQIVTCLLCWYLRSEEGFDPLEVEYMLFVGE